MRIIEASSLAVLVFAVYNEGLLRVLSSCLSESVASVALTTLNF